MMRGTTHSLFMLALALAACGHAPPALQDTWAITNVAVIDVVTGIVRDGQTIIIRGRHINAIGPSHSTRTPRGARVVDATGSFVIPGLFDMHAHVWDPVPEGLVNQMGYAQLQIGRGERAIEVFRRNVELYPASANVYDSLADALEPAGALEEALRNRDEAVRRAEELGDDRLQTFRRKRDDLRARLTAEAGR